MHTLAALTADTIPSPAPPLTYTLEVRQGATWRPYAEGHAFDSTSAAMAVVDLIVMEMQPQAIRLMRSDGPVVFAVYFAGGQ